MIMKTEENGSVTLKYDGSWADLMTDIKAYAVCDSTTSSIKSTIEEVTKKPEVRADQRSTLKVGPRQVSAYYYKDGFRTNEKDLIPTIKSIEVFNENTVKITFVNGDVQKSTAQNGDIFSLEDGIVRCIAKEMIGKEGSAILNKLVSYATKIYNDAEKDKYEKAIEEEKKRIASEKNYEKAKKHWAKKRAMEREKRIQEMAEAIVRAKAMESK